MVSLFMPGGMTFDIHKKKLRARACTSRPTGGARTPVNNLAGNEWLDAADDVAVQTHPSPLLPTIDASEQHT